MRRDDARCETINLLSWRNLCGVGIWKIRKKKEKRKEGRKAQFEVVCKNQHKMNEKNIGNY